MRCWCNISFTFFLLLLLSIQRCNSWSVNAVLVQETESIWRQICVENLCVHFSLRCWQPHRFSIQFLCCFCVLVNLLIVWYCLHVVVSHRLFTDHFFYLCHRFDSLMLCAIQCVEIVHALCVRLGTNTVAFTDWLHVWHLRVIGSGIEIKLRRWCRFDALERSLLAVLGCHTCFLGRKSWPLSFVEVWDITRLLELFLERFVIG